MRVIGSLLDAGALQPSRSARNHLLWLAHSQGLGARRVDEVIEQAGLQGVARRRAGGYSLGMRQRLGIAAAMLGNPAAIMLDEPFNGMDPEGIVWMRGFLRSLAASGRAVLVSSHLMSELQDTADHLVVVGRGKVIADTTVASLLAAASGDRVTLRTSEPGRRRRRCWRTRGPPSSPAARTCSRSPGWRPSGWSRCSASWPCRSPRSPRTGRPWSRPIWSSPRQAVEFRPAGFDADAAQEVPR